MTDAQLIELINDLCAVAGKGKEFKALQVLRKTIPPERRNLYDALVDLRIAGIDDNPEAITVVLVHGIQTDGAWQSLVQREFVNIPNCNTECIGYDFFNAVQLFSVRRGRPIEKITRELRDIRSKEPRAKLIVIAHSFGTYIISKILQNSPDIKFNKIVFCGSIVPRDFRWDVHARELEQGSIVNDVGTKDNWPLIATALTIGYGASGRLGFQTSRVADRYFPYGHSDFFCSDHIKKYWLPVVRDKEIIKSKFDGSRPKSSLLVLLLSNWVQAKIAFGILIALVFYVI